MGSSGLCKRALVQMGYAIGVAKPLSLFVETYGTEQGDLTAEAITNIVKLNFDARPGALARDLQLLKPKYNVTAAYCHFGRQPRGEGHQVLLVGGLQGPLQVRLDVGGRGREGRQGREEDHPHQVGRLEPFPAEVARPRRGEVP